MQQPIKPPTLPEIYCCPCRCTSMWQPVDTLAIGRQDKKRSRHTNLSVIIHSGCSRWTSRVTHKALKTAFEHWNFDHQAHRHLIRAMVANLKNKNLPGFCRHITFVYTRDQQQRVVKSTNHSTVSQFVSEWLALKSTSQSSLNQSVEVEVNKPCTSEWIILMGQYRPFPWQAKERQLARCTSLIMFILCYIFWQRGMLYYIHTKALLSISKHTPVSL